MSALPLLSILIILPIFGALVIAIIQSKEVSIKNNVRYITFIVMFIYSITILYLVVSLDKYSNNLQFINRINILPYINFSYFVALDELSIIFLIILSISFTIAFIFIPFPENNIKIYAISFLLVLTGATGLFISQDVIMFFIFYEASIIPIYILIKVFGGSENSKANMLFIIYNIGSSMLMLVAITYMVSITKDSSLYSIVSYKYNLTHSYWLFWGLFTAFAVKSGLVPFNSWLPITYKNSPIALNIILTAVIAKFGFFGIIKLVIPALSDLAKHYNYIIYIITAVSVFYGVLAALRSNNIKTIIAYLSISHIAFLIATPFSINIYAIHGSIFQALNHSLYNIGFFLIIAALQHRHNSDDISKFTNLGSSAPILSFFIIIIGLASMAFPLTSTFVSELLMLLGIFSEYRIYGVIFTFSILFNGAVMVVLYRKLIFSASGEHKQTKDINFREIIGLSIVALLIIILGIFPNLILSITQNYSTLWTELLKPSIPVYIDNTIN